MSQFVNQVMFLRSAFDDLNRRLIAVEQRQQQQLSPPPAPAAAAPSEPVAETKKAMVEEVQQQLGADVRREVRCAVEKEKHVLETMLGYKVEQTVSKLVRERVEQLRSELQTAQEAVVDIAAPGAEPGPGPGEDEPAVVSAGANEESLVLKKKKTSARSSKAQQST